MSLPLRRLCALLAIVCAAACKTTPPAAYDFGGDGGRGPGDSGRDAPRDSATALRADSGGASPFEAGACLVNPVAAPPQPDAGAFIAYDAGAATGIVAEGGAPRACPPGDTGAGLACVPPACTVDACTGGGTTTISGTVYAPNGVLPLYDVQVFIPGSPLDALPRGVQCDRCGAALSGSPITTALSDPAGHFTLTGAPSGANIPIVVQLGKWRRLAVIPQVAPCATTTLTDPNLTRLPKNQSEGSMPHIALTTGACDYLGCMLPKVGIDPAEFGYQADGCARAVNVYNGDVGIADPTSLLAATTADQLWGVPANLATYDLAIFSCECSEALESKGGSPTAPEFSVVTDYLNAGGRVFTTDFQYTWYKYSPDPNLGGGAMGNDTTGIGSIAGGAPSGDSPISLVTTFPKGQALAEWLANAFPARECAGFGEVAPSEVFANVQSLNSEAVIWGASGASAARAPRVFSVDTPAGAPTSQQCGRGVHLDAHVNSGGAAFGSFDAGAFVSDGGLATSGGDLVGCKAPGVCYPATCQSPLTQAEAMFAFFFFDVSSCIQDETQAPQPPPAAPK